MRATHARIIPAGGLARSAEACRPAVERVREERMRCQFCDEPAAVHLTDVDADTGEKTQVHVCLKHARNAGLPTDTVRKMTQRMDATRRAMEALQAFVASARRTPSLDELRALGVAAALLPADPNDPQFPSALAQLGAMAQMMLDELPPPPQ